MPLDAEATHSSIQLQMFHLVFMEKRTVDEENVVEKKHQKTLLGY